MNLTPSPEPSPSLPLLQGQTSTPPPEVEEGETLAQRKRRLKNRETLNTAISDVQSRPVSGEFMSEMMSQFGPPSSERETANAATAPVDEEEETLGQRRARLQAEALARGGSTNSTMLNPSSATRPPLRASHSMADILAAHPLTAGTRKVSDEMLVNSLPQGSLLQKNEARKTRHKADMMEQNRRSTSYGLDKPLLGDMGAKPPSDQALAAKIQAFKGGVYNQGSGGLNTMSTPSLIPTPMTMPATMPGMGLGHQSGYFGNAGMTPNSMSMNFMPMMQQPMMGMGMPMNGFGFQHMGSMQPGMQGMPMPMPMAMGMGMQQMEAGMDQRQRDMIDRWRQSVAQ